MVKYGKLKLDFIISIKRRLLWTVAPIRSCYNIYVEITWAGCDHTAKEDGRMDYPSLNFWCQMLPAVSVVPR